MPCRGSRRETSGRPEWCWAACLQMVLGKFGLTRTQCELADEANGMVGCRDCAAAQSSIRYDQPLAVSQVTAEYGKHQIACTQHNEPISYRSVQLEIAADRPVQVGIDWGLGCHAVLIVGWDEGPDGQYLLVNWPRLAPTDASAVGCMLYQELVSPNGNTGIWRWTWTGIGAL